METVLLTGASGFVGSRFVKRWASDYDILTPTHAELDITDEKSVKHYFALHRPRIVLHLAAISNTWQCEQNPQESYRVNVLGTQLIAGAAAMCGARFVFFSSDQVYNGNLETGALAENVSVNPETCYARHKLEAERLALGACEDSVVLRATWMYDYEDSGLPQHANFVVNLNRAVKEAVPVSFPVREYRGITWVGEVVEFLPQTFGLPPGVYNYGAENRLNTYETACCYFEMLSVALKCCDIVIPDSDRYPQHERNIAMTNRKIFNASNGYINFSDTLDGLRIFIMKNSLAL